MSNINKEKQIICQLIIKAREEANLTQKQVCETGIVSQSELSKIENGMRKLDFLTLLHLSKLYNKDLEFFNPYKKK